MINKILKKAASLKFKNAYVHVYARLNDCDAILFVNENDFVDTSLIETNAKTLNKALNEMLNRLNKKDFERKI